MYKFEILCIVALAASVSGAPGGLVVPVVATAPAVAVAHPVHLASSYSNTYRAPVVKAIPVVKTVIPVVANPIIAAPLVAAHPIVKTTHQVVAHPAPAIVKTAPLPAHSPVTIAHTPLVHAAPIAAVHALPVASYGNHYKVTPVIKTHVVAAPVTIVH